MDIICILMKNYFHVYDHNSSISMDINCILMKYYFHVFNHNHVFQMDVFAFY